MLMAREEPSVGGVIVCGEGLLGALVPVLTYAVRGEFGIPPASAGRSLSFDLSGEQGIRDTPFDPLVT
jgi:hypothetical protein